MNIDFNLSKEQKSDLYYQALIMAFKTFLEEEQKGYSATELRLMSKIDASRKLYKN